MDTKNNARIIGGCNDINGCSICPDFHNPPCNTCNIKLDTLPCNPNEPEFWNNQLNISNHNEIVKTNIINSCWQCNHEDSYEMNSELCRRSLYDGYIPNPIEYTTDVDIQSHLKNINKPLSKHPPTKKR